MSVSRSLVLTSLGTIGAGALLLVGCNGKTLSLGTDTTQSQLVSPSDVSGTVTPCDANAAHPNVCCTSGAGEQAACLVYPDAPFTPCASGATTYPDPRSCCPLDGSGSCSAPPPVVGIPSGGGACSYACPPGSYAPPDASYGECCQTDSTGATACSGPSSPLPTPTCPSCPPAWQVPQGDPAQCCTTDPNGIIECFSQASPPQQPPVDAGPPVVDAGSPAVDAGSPPPPPPIDAGAGSPTCSGATAPDGGLGPCECHEQANGHTYVVGCDPTSNLCICTVDNGSPTTTFPDNGNTCSDATALFTSCGFPAN
jgi:hypothetical protein